MLIDCPITPCPAVCNAIDGAYDSSRVAHRAFVAFRFVFLRLVPPPSPRPHRALGMHRCLQVFEVISQIFSEIDGHVYDTRMRYPTRIRHREAAALRTLAGLARTCRAFKEPALDVLWREIPDLFVLIKHLMPEELLRYDEESSELVRSRLHSSNWSRS